MSIMEQSEKLLKIPDKDSHYVEIVKTMENARDSDDEQINTFQDSEKDQNTSLESGKEQFGENKKSYENHAFVNVHEHEHEGSDVNEIVNISDNLSDSMRVSTGIYLDAVEDEESATGTANCGDLEENVDCNETKEEEMPQNEIQESSKENEGDDKICNENDVDERQSSRADIQSDKSVEVEDESIVEEEEEKEEREVEEASWIVDEIMEEEKGNHIRLEQIEPVMIRDERKKNEVRGVSAEKETITNFQMMLLCLKLIFTSLDHLSDILVLTQLWKNGFFNFFFIGLVIDLFPGVVTVLQFRLLNFSICKMKERDLTFNLKVVKFSSESRGLLEAPLQLVFTTTLIAISVLPSPFDPDQVPIFSNYHGAKLYLSFIPVSSVIMSFITIIIDASMSFNIWMSPFANSWTVFVSWLFFLIPTICFRLQTWVLLFTYLMEFIALPVGLILALNLTMFIWQRHHLNSNPIVLSIYSFAFPIINLNINHDREQSLVTGLFIIKILTVVGTLILLGALWAVYGIIIIAQKLPYIPEIRISREAIVYLMASSSILGVLTITSPFLILSQETGKTFMTQVKQIVSRGSLVLLSITIFMVGLANLGKTSLQRDTLAITKVCSTTITPMKFDVLRHPQIEAFPITTSVRKCQDNSLQDLKSKVLIGCYNDAFIMEDKAPSSPIDVDLKGYYYVFVKPGQTNLTKLKEHYRVFCTERKASVPSVDASDLEFVDPNGAYDYQKALSLSLLFYEAQRSGPLPEDNRIPWRADSMLQDEVPGGYFFSGGHTKYNFPLASMTTQLAWGAISFYEGYECAKELDHMYSALKWATDYLVDCFKSDKEIYVQFGKTDAEDSKWIRPEDDRSHRPAYTIGGDRCGSDLAGEAAAALAASSIFYKIFDKDDDAEEALEMSRNYYDFAVSCKGKYSDSLLDENKPYKSWSGFEDELGWGACWMYKATKEPDFLTKCKKYYNNDLVKEFSWDNKFVGHRILLYDITREDKYISDINKFVDFLIHGAQYTPKGLILVQTIGHLRHAANLAHACAQIAHLGLNKEACNKFINNQIKYILGSTGYSYQIGYGDKFPLKPHHRASSCLGLEASCNWWPNYESPDPNPNVLKGAVVYGPNERDKFEDDRKDHAHNQPTLDNNAGFQSAVAYLVMQNCNLIA